MVDTAGHQFLAGSGFTQHQHSGLGGGDLPQVVEQRHHLVAVADKSLDLALDVGGAGSPAPAALLPGAFALGQYAADRGDHVAVVEGFGDVIDSAHTHGIHRGTQAGVTRHDQYRHLAGELDQIRARGAGQAQVADDEIEGGEIVLAVGFADRGRLADAIVVALQQAPQRRPDDGLVFDYQDLGCRHVCHIPGVTL